MVGLALAGLGLAAMGCGSGHLEASTPPPPQADVTVHAGSPQPQQDVVYQQQQPQPQQVVVHQQPQPQTVVVQTQQGGIASNFGQVTIRPGFTPDPHVVQGTSGGQQAASQRDRRCAGWISGMPDHIVRLEGEFNHLRIMAAAAADTTLVVQTPSGTYLCDDDSDGRNPMVQGRFQGGQYLVWVGSYQQGVNSQYRLGFSELRRIRPSSLGTTMTTVTTQPTTGVTVNTGGSNFGTVTLSPGFTPDPAVHRGVSGGALNANNMGGMCRGWISQQPDHIMVTQGNFQTLRIMARSQQDTTLVIADQSGRVWCDDDGGEGSNPMIVSALPRGTYRVWVGSYRQGTNANYTIGFSELSSVGTFSLPAP
jgi:hypothetical protein